MERRCEQGDMLRHRNVVNLRTFGLSNGSTLPMLSLLQSKLCRAFITPRLDEALHTWLMLRMAGMRVDRCRFRMRRNGRSGGQTCITIRQLCHSCVPVLRTTCATHTSMLT